MPDYNFTLEKLRFHLQKEDTLVFYGWYRGNNPDGRTLRVYLDRDELRLNQHINSGLEIRQKYLSYLADINEEVFGEVKLPYDWRQFHRFKIVCVHGLERKTIASVSTRELKKMYREVGYYLESEQAVEGRVVISGWAMGSGPVDFSVTNKKGEEIPVQVERYYRKDIAGIYEEAPEDYKAGFKATVQARGLRTFTFSMKSGEAQSCYKTSVHRILRGKTKAHAAAPGLMKKIAAYYRRNGVRATFKRVFTKLLRKPEQNYHSWRKRHLISAEELERQRREPPAYAPLFSIVIPLYKTPQHYLKEMLDSVVAQTYTNWELCLADGSGTNNSGSVGNMRGFVEHRYGLDKRVRYVLLNRNKGIADNTNSGLLMVRGEYVVFADHDDILPPEALYECAKALNEDRSIDMIYTDEDKVDMESRKYFEPNFKPDFNPDLLCSMNYICHLCVISKSLLERVGWLDSQYDGAQDYDFILRCAESAKHIHHIPKVLYHWRTHPDSTAVRPESKLYAFEAGRRALLEHYARLEIPAKVEHSSFYGMYHTIYRWNEEPLLSILIPNKDHLADLQKCVQSILDKSSYRNFEFVIIENNSTEEKTFAGYKAMEEACDKVRVVYYEGEFNFSRINNFGAKHAKGEYFLLLNNDTELISPDALWEMLGYCMRGDVGAVGAKLCYPDDTIQHAGVVIGFGGVAGHTFIGSSRFDLGYQARIACVQNYSAVTAACLMTPRKVFEAVGGMTEELQVAFNDIDYCLKVRALGKLVVYTPYAELYHYESKSRGLEDTPQKVARFNREADLFRERWPDILLNGDPYYNPNLSLDKADFSLK